MRDDPAGAAGGPRRARRNGARTARRRAGLGRTAPRAPPGRGWIADGAAALAYLPRSLSGRPRRLRRRLPRRSPPGHGRERAAGRHRAAPRPGVRACRHPARSAVADRVPPRGAARAPLARLWSHLPALRGLELPRRRTGPPWAGAARLRGRPWRPVPPRPLLRAAARPRMEALGSTRAPQARPLRGRHAGADAVLAGRRGDPRLRRALRPPALPPRGRAPRRGDRGVGGERAPARPEAPPGPAGAARGPRRVGGARHGRAPPLDAAAAAARGAGPVPSATRRRADRRAPAPGPRSGGR